MTASGWKDGKRYRSFSGYLQELFSCRVHKISLDAGFTCPNRDGARGTGGCVYCSNEGFSYNTRQGVPELANQLEQGMTYMRRRFKAHKFIAYFQAFSSTYAPPDRLKATYDLITTFPDIVGLFISTRPDCVADPVLDLLSSYRRDYLVWLELGLQSASDRTLKTINRGHTVADFTDALKRSKDRGLPVCAHVILGLPGENRDDMLETADYLGHQGVRGVKIHALHLLRGTPLAADYAKLRFPLLSLEEYAGLVCDFLERLPREVVVQRLAPEVPRAELVGPGWCANKLAAVSVVEAELERRKSCQGALFGDTA